MRILDLSVLLLAGHVATYCRFGATLSEVAPVHAVMLYFCAALTVVLFPQCDLYASWRGRALLSLGMRLAMSWSLVLLAGLVFSFLIHHVGDLSRLWMLYWYLCGLCLLLVARAGLHLLLKHLRARGFNQRRVLIVGDNRIGRELASRARRQAWYGHQVVGVHPGCGDAAVLPDLPEPSDPTDLAHAAALADLPQPDGHAEQEEDDACATLEAVSTQSAATPPSTSRAMAPVVALRDLADFVIQHRIDELWVTLPMTAAPELQALHLLSGFLAVASIDGVVCGGLICFRNGTYTVAKVVADDRAFYAYCLGTLCYYRTICEAILRGGTVFNLGMQRYDYKTRLLGARRDLDRVTVYRSRWTQVRRVDQVLGMRVDAFVRQAKLRLMAHEDSLLTRIMMRLSGGGPVRATAGQKKNAE